MKPEKSWLPSPAHRRGPRCSPTGIRREPASSCPWSSTQYYPSERKKNRYAIEETPALRWHFIFPLTRGEGPTREAAPQLASGGSLAGVVPVGGRNCSASPRGRTSPAPKLGYANPLLGRRGPATLRGTAVALFRLPTGSESCAFFYLFDCKIQKQN